MMRSGIVTSVRRAGIWLLRVRRRARGQREKMASEAAREIYKQRSQIAEFPNAWIKEKFGLRQFRLRGLIKVTMEAMWVAIAYNLSQWIRLCWKPKKVMVGALN